MRIVRRLTHVLAIVLTLVVGAAAAAVIVSQTAWFKNWLRGYIVREANRYVNGTLTIGRLGGNLFFGVEMENVGLSMDGSPVVAVKDVGLDYNVFQLIAKGLSVDNIRLDKPVIYLRRDGDGWSLGRLVKRQETEADRSGPARPIAIDDIGISDGSVVIESAVGPSGVDVPKRFDHLDAKLSFKYEPVRYSIQITHVSFRGSEPSIALNALSGGVSVKDDTVYVDTLALRTAETSLSMDGLVQQYLSKPVFNLQISSDKLSVPELARLVPALAGVRLQPSFNVKVDGPLDHLGLEMHVQSSAGVASGRVVADLVAPGQSVAGEVWVRHLDLSPILNNPRQKSDITANARVDLHGEALSNVYALHGTIALDSPRLMAAGYVAERVQAKARLDQRHVALDGRAAAYGATATFAGTVTLPDGAGHASTLAYDVHGQARHVDLRRLPRELNVPPAATDVNADYHAVGSVGSGSSRTLPERGVANASVAKTSVAKTSVVKTSVVKTSVVKTSVVSGLSRTDVDLRFEPSTVAGARVAAGSTVGLSVSGKDIRYTADAKVADLDLQRVGEQFKAPALAVDRYKSAINGHVVARGSGTTPKARDLTARGTLTDTSILGGEIPRMDFEAAIARDTAHVKATGSFSGFDPAVASGKPAMQGTVAGTVDLDATFANVSGGVTPASVQADAKVTLQPSAIGGLEITRASFEGTYHDSTGDIRALEVVGRDVNVQASGRLALDDSGRSNLKVHADSPSLEAIGKLIDEPLTGMGTVDASFTGNRRELHATGHVTADGVTYGENGALTVSSDFTARVPELTLADAAVTAKTHATFVTVGGQNINELDANTTYRQQQIDFDATAKQPQRSLAAAGTLLLHPDHQEVHLQRLRLQAEGQTWQLAQGPPATINYAHDAISVEHITLTNGDQQIAADGTFGRTGDALKVTLRNVELAGVDALLLRPPQFTGRLNASSTISGTRDAPAVAADFTVTQGGFRQFHYDTFGGTVRYAGAGVTLDTKLQRNATTFITAKGYVPTALFERGATDDRDAAHGAPVVPEDRIDLHLDSSPIDLGLVQGFTTALTNVTGTLQAKIDVGGSAADPHPTGAVTLADGAFTVGATGVAYTHLKGTIDLQPDKVHIDNISVLDNHQAALSLTGDLAVHERQLGGVLLYVTARDFKVIDNKLGNLRVRSDLEIAGELRSPRVTGDLGVETGQINLDEIVALAGDSAYATKATEYLTPAGTANATQPPASPASAFDALKMDVHFTVPDDLVVKGNDLKTPGAPIGLGAMNLTLGGDVRATKAPGRQVVLVGAVNTVRGTYDFQGRRFDILRDGTVRFDGDALNELNPVLDIRARRLIQGVEARVNVRGTLKAPEIVLASTPPLEPADILSLIVFNQPINQLGEGQQMSLARRAQQLATGALSGELAQSIGHALGVDTFEISTASDSGAAAQLTIGQQVGQNLYVKVQQGVGDQSTTNVILEYELGKWLRLQTNVLQGSSTQQQLFQRMQGSGIDLLFFFSY